MRWVGEVDFGISKGFHNYVEDILFGHAKHLLAEFKALHDLAEVRRKSIDSCCTQAQAWNKSAKNSGHYRRLSFVGLSYCLELTVRHS